MYSIHVAHIFHMRLWNVNKFTVILKNLPVEHKYNCFIDQSEGDYKN